MAIHAKASGMLISGQLLDNTKTHWKFHAFDEKRPKMIAKDDPKNQVFHGPGALERAEQWQLKCRKAKD